jgi:hypothetical protein
LAKFDLLRKDFLVILAPVLAENHSVGPKDKLLTLIHCVEMGCDKIQIDNFRKLKLVISL